MPAELMRKANHGREVLRADGSFAFPKGVRRVWIDVGAHHLETTRDELLRYPDLGLVAIEPLAECWDRWPASDRLIGLPVAIYLERGTMDFHVNALDDTSSLAESVPGTRFADVTRTVEVRKVPVLRLEDVLGAIPQDLSVDYVKTDVQGVDLQVLQSGGWLLRRSHRVRAEVITQQLYRAVGRETPASEQQVLDYMGSMGFSLAGDTTVWGNPAWEDLDFVNVRCWSLADRLWHDIRFGRAGA